MFKDHTNSYVFRLSVACLFLASLNLLFYVSVDKVEKQMSQYAITHLSNNN